MIILYRENRVWKIWPEGDVLFYGGGVNHGAEVIHQKLVEPKASRSLAEQLELEINSRVSKQLDKGYSYEQNKPATNQLNYERPMLALAVEKAKNISYKNAVVQLKLDGNRCLLRGTSKGIIAYSRQGKLINLPHITEGWSLPEGATIDGELYCHGETLQTICSWIKRQQPESKKLQFMAYDCISSANYLDRKVKLALLLLHAPLCIEQLKSTFYRGEEQLWDTFRQARNDGYEGLIIRLDGYGYQSGKRSKGLLKVKEWLDDNFVVKDIYASSDNLAVLDCGFFSVVAPGTHLEREYILEHAEDYIGKVVEVQYACLTVDGIPFHPVALRWIK